MAEKPHNDTPAEETAAAGLPAERIVESLLFCSDEPVTVTRLREVAPELAGIDVRKLVRGLNREYERRGHSFRIRNIAGGYQLFTIPEFDPYIERLHARRQSNRLSTKALETLAIIAYRQPVTRHDIEEIRGVNADGVLRTLLSRNLITISGAAATPGNPYLYKTTRQFLEHFGLKNIKELPRLKEFDEIVQADSELKDMVEDELLKELELEKLGLAEDGREEEQEESADESSAD